MRCQSMSRTVRRLPDELSADIEADPGLRALAESTQRLIAGLRAGAGEAALRGLVAPYVACAATQGISRARIHDALEFLVHDHAVPDYSRVSEEPVVGRRTAAALVKRRHQATAHVLDLVLRLASDAERGPARLLQEAV